MMFTGNFSIKISYPTIQQLKKYVGKFVAVSFKDGTTTSGILGFTEEFSEKYGYRKPNYFTVKDYDFKVSHIKSATVYPAQVVFTSEPLEKQRPNIGERGR